MGDVPSYKQGTHIRHQYMLRLDVCSSAPARVACSAAAAPCASHCCAAGEYESAFRPRARGGG
eukprot:12474387-Alexandrium_andersonii.AAC.1